MDILLIRQIHFTAKLSRDVILSNAAPRTEIALAGKVSTFCIAGENSGFVNTIILVSADPFEHYVKNVGCHINEVRPPCPTFVGHCESMSGLNA